MSIEICSSWSKFVGYYLSRKNHSNLSAVGRSTLILIFFLLLLCPNASSAAVDSKYQSDLPLYEIGLGVFALRMNQYRGSNQYSNYYWPLPFFIYRGEKIYAKNSMITGNIYEKDRFKLGLSMMASLRVSNANNKARSEMPSLDPTLEVGPEFSWNLLEDKEKLHLFYIALPIRQAVAVEFFRARAIGQFMVPYISVLNRPQKMTLGFFTELTFAVMFATSKYHQYFYGVEPQYVRPGRSSYNAKGGYSGAHLTFYLSRRFKSLYLYGFSRYDRLDGVVFEDSPLMKQKHYWASGGGFIWYFYESTERARKKYD